MEVKERLAKGLAHRERGREKPSRNECKTKPSGPNHAGKQLNVIPLFKLDTNRGTVIGRLFVCRRDESGLMEVGLPFSPAGPCGIVSLSLINNLHVYTPSLN